MSSEVPARVNAPPVRSVPWLAESSAAWWAALLDHVAVKAGTLIDAEHPGDATHHAADDPADHGANRTGGAFAFA